MNAESYNDEIRNIARNAFDEARDDLDGDTPDFDDVAERIWEDVDAHSWVIYTWRNVEVLQHATNPDAAWDMDLPPNDCNSYGEMMMRLAFCALYQDVIDYLQEMFDDWTADAEI